MHGLRPTGVASQFHGDTSEMAVQSMLFIERVIRGLLALSLPALIPSIVARPPSGGGWMAGALWHD